MGYMVPLGHSNKAACGVKLLPATVLSWHVAATLWLFCALLNTQWLFPCASGWFNPPSASHPPQHPPHPPHTRPPTPIELIHDIGGVQKSVSKSSNIS